MPIKEEEEILLQCACVLTSLDCSVGSRISLPSSFPCRCATGTSFQANEQLFGGYAWWSCWFGCLFHVSFGTQLPIVRMRTQDSMTTCPDRNTVMKNGGDGLHLWFFLSQVSFLGFHVLYTVSANPIVNFDIFITCCFCTTYPIKPTI
jgi:hypothetical protein